MSTRIGVFGGTFDPVHTGHLIVADAVRERLNLTTVILVPARQSPFKSARPLASDADRRRMIELAIAGRPWFEVSAVELDRPGHSYTVETLRALREARPGELYFLMGYDQVHDLPGWRSPEEIVRLARIVGMRRPDYPEPDLAGLYARIPAARGRIELVEVPRIEISATDLRDRRSAGRQIDWRVPQAVQEYIEARGLYLKKETTESD